MSVESVGERQPDEAKPPIIFEAIVRQRCVTAIYNRMHVLLAPHIAYTRHGDLFIDAVTIERDGNPPREEKLGTFKLAGLNDVTLTDRMFAISALFEPEAEKYDGAALIKVERDAVAA